MVANRVWWSNQHERAGSGVVLPKLSVLVASTRALKLSRTEVAGRILYAAEPVRRAGPGLVKPR